MSKIEAGKTALENLDFSLSQTVNEIVQLFRVKAGAKKIQLSAKPVGD